jgi:TetR/AcrR family transcriptional regulator, tetracycline repressor protein
MGQKPGRPKSGQERLTRARILSTALALTDAQGVEALNMRRLASALGVDPMAIYHHVPNKRALLAGITELAFDALQVPQAEGMRWQDQVRAFAQGYRTLIQAHPQLVLHLVADLESGAGAILRANEMLYTALVEAGLPPRLVVHAADLVVDYLHGVALAEGLQRTQRPGETQDLRQLMKRYPAERFPVQREVFEKMATEKAAANMDQEPPDAWISASMPGLEIILLGIEAMTVQARS